MDQLYSILFELECTIYIPSVKNSYNTGCTLSEYEGVVLDSTKVVIPSSKILHVLQYSLH